jgi:hypothetical protein
MKKNIFRYLKSYSTEPLYIDRLIVSAYLHINKLIVTKNINLKLYLITEGETEEFLALQQFIEVIHNEIYEFNIEDLIEFFEFVISPSDRIINGAIYTPIDIRNFIVEETFKTRADEIHNIKTADIACGCGGFLYTMASKLKELTGKRYFDIFKEQVYGLDIQEYSIIRTKLLLSILALSEGEDEYLFQFNLYQGDSLIFKWDEVCNDFDGFQIIVGNPPYVCARNLDSNVKENLKNWSVSKSGNPDLYIPFFQIGFELLREGGILGYITMNTFFKSLNGRALRDYFKQKRIRTRIIDFGTQQIFKSKSTYTCICFIEKAEQPSIKYYASENRKFPECEEQYEEVLYETLDSKKGWNLRDNIIISKIESIGTPFGELFKTRHGIATLKNSIYIFNPVDEDLNFYFLLNEGVSYPIEKDLCRDIINSNKLSREVDLKMAMEKIIFPYDNNPKPKLLRESIFKRLYPFGYKYLKKMKLTLAERDKGTGKYEKWFAFGRTQSLERVMNKLFFPKMSDVIPSYIINSDENLLFYNGQAIIGHTMEEMILAKKIMQSSVFWYYIKTTSKPYSSNYYSLNGNYIRNFGVCTLTDGEKEFVLKENNQMILDAFFERKYYIDFSEKTVNVKKEMSEVLLVKTINN